MTTSVAVFPPGFRVTDADDNPISGATIEFYGAGTTTPKTVYSDADLTVAIGTSVTTDAGGYPTSGGNKAIVYTNEAPYKIVMKDALGVAFATHDNVKGAVEGTTTSGSSGTTGFGMAVGDVKISLSASPDAGFVRLTEATQNLLKADYPDLNAWAAAQTYPWGSTATTFGIPPAAGYFMRFAGTTASIDPDGPRSPGSTQADAMLQHFHNQGTLANSDDSHTHDITNHIVTINQGYTTSGPNAPSTYNTFTTPTYTHTHTITGNTGDAGTGSETRAKNVAFHADMLAIPSAVSASIIGAAGLSYTYVSSTTPTDATSGKFNFNNASPGSATVFNVNETDNLGSAFATLWNSLPSGTRIYGSKVGAPAVNFSFVTTAAGTDNGTYDSFAVGTALSNGTFANGDKFSLIVMLPGTSFVDPAISNAWTAQQYFALATLADGATINWNLQTQQSAQVTLGGNRTLASPTNKKAGAVYTVLIKQDATGSRTLAWGSDYKFRNNQAPTLSTAAGAVDAITFWSDGTYLYAERNEDVLVASDIPDISATYATRTTSLVNALVFG